MKTDQHCLTKDQNAGRVQFFLLSIHLEFGFTEFLFAPEIYKNRKTNLALNHNTGYVLPKHLLFTSPS